ncbi:predicted protein [Uncinocarpus reesii 1704]|uniref:Uncharacterized protein n=1 Tax=Uncinocarpus reesii (strain UAMH 1704) TaxID=336963 RepID=C4JEZ6_UNCRE|nr:uncharacterized protein UREG_00897 [Uncinocarpus reesii 1704]EEP76049.1 predicted protein [Uncinocarpus reesii 1704]
MGNGLMWEFRVYETFRLLIGVDGAFGFSFNSAVFSSLSAHQYSVLTVAADYASNANWTANESSVSPLERGRIAKIQQGYAYYQRLERDMCVSEYGKQYLTSRRNVILVATETDADSKMILDYQYVTPKWDPWNMKDSFNWICGNVDAPHCDINAVLGSSNWTVAGNTPVDYCLGEVVPEQCRIYFSSAVMIGVIIANFAKFISLWVAALKYTKPTLVTMGDAITSFLKSPDPWTLGMCFVQKEDLRASSEPHALQSPRAWAPKKRFWFQTVGGLYLLLFALFAVGSITSCAVLLWRAVHELDKRGSPTDITSLWKMGFGTVNAFSLIAPEVDYGKLPFAFKSTIGAIVLVNMPQLILSLSYLVINRNMTAMLTARELSTFASKRKPLRVTSPAGEQRSTYFLQLPYRYAIPLVFVSTVLHWLVSQSFFIAKIVALEDGKENADNSTAVFGYSAIALVFVLVAACVLVVGVCSIGARTSGSGTLLAGVCSLVISARCHPLPEEGDISAKPLQWGVVKQ